MLRTVSLWSLLFCAVSSARAESPFKEIDPGEGVYRIVDNECLVNGDYVKRVSLTASRGVSILYTNRTELRVRPNVKVLLLDKYGLPIKMAKDQWLSSLSPKESRSHTTYFQDVDIVDLLRFTTVPLPDDMGKPLYIAVEE